MVDERSMVFSDKMLRGKPPALPPGPLGRDGTKAKKKSPVRITALWVRKLRETRKENEPSGLQEMGQQTLR